jgi:hypothetical protein
MNHEPTDSIIPKSSLEQKFSDLWIDLYPDIDMHSEYQFHPRRKFRFDFAHLPSRTAIELQGGIWVTGTGHNSGAGLLRDYEKLNLATINGWNVFMFADSQITKGWLHTIAAHIERRGELFPLAHDFDIPNKRGRICQERDRAEQLGLVLNC